MKRGSLLLVDDDRPLLESMAAGCASRAIQRRRYDRRVRAIAALGKKPYDLALSDIRLGDGDGFDSWPIAASIVPAWPCF